MKREEFVANCNEIRKLGYIMSEENTKDWIHNHRNMETDIPTCIGELAELSLELTRFQRGKMDMDDFLQELSHVQWAVWFESFGTGSRLPTGGIPFLNRLINFKPQRAGRSKGCAVVHFTLASSCPLRHTPRSGEKDSSPIPFVNTNTIEYQFGDRQTSVGTPQAFASVL